jgi:hypothetical protein
MPPQAAAARTAPADPRRAPARPRRTVEIRGQGAPAPVVPLRPEFAADALRPRRRSRPAPARPDRVAMWAVFLGIFMVLVAALSAHA